MSSFPDPIKSTALVVYTPPQSPIEQAKACKEWLQTFVMERSFKTQIADCRSSAVTVRALFLAGAMPSPQIGPGLPEPFHGTMADFLDGVRVDEPCTVRETVNKTIDSISYNGLLPFNKTAKQILDGKKLIETRIDSRNEEETGSTCIGMCHSLLKQLSEQHGIEGMYAARRQKGHTVFQHATVIVECADGYVLLDPRSHSAARIFPIPFHETVSIRDKTYTAASARSQIPVFLTEERGDYEFCTNIANADDLVTKHFLMKAPFPPPEDPAFPITAYYLDGKMEGRGSRTIWVSPLYSKFTFKNDTVGDDPERTAIIPYNDVLEEGFRAQLERFYVAGTPPTFNIDVGSLYAQLVQFVENADIIDAMFHEVYSG